MFGAGWSKRDLGEVLHSYAVSYCPNDPSPIDLWNRVKPTMATRANLSVFLYELRDVRRMFQVIPSKHLTVVGTKRRITDWRSAIKYGNDFHLNYNFGWKPFTRDVVQTFRAVSSFEKRLTRFVTSQNQILSRKVSKDPTLTFVNATWTLPYNAGFKVTVTGSIETIHSAAFRFAYSIPRYSEGEMRWRSWADSLGLNISPANVWAVIPWSFVADWFVNVGKGLDTVSQDWIEPIVDVLQAYHSSKWTYSLTFKVTPQGSFSGGAAPVGAIQGTRYGRHLGMPSYNMTGPDLNADRIRLLASLVAGRII